MRATLYSVLLAAVMATIVTGNLRAAPLALCVFVAGIAAILGAALSIALLSPIWSRTRE